MDEDILKLGVKVGVGFIGVWFFLMCCWMGYRVSYLSAQNTVAREVEAQVNQKLAPLNERLGAYEKRYGMYI